MFCDSGCQCGAGSEQKTVPPPPKPVAQLPRARLYSRHLEPGTDPPTPPQPANRRSLRTRPTLPRNGFEYRATYSPRLIRRRFIRPHSSSNSTGASGSGSSIYKPSTSGPTVYTPHSSASSSTGSGVSGSTTYKPSHLAQRSTRHTPRQVIASTPNRCCGPVRM